MKTINVEEIIQLCSFVLFYKDFALVIADDDSIYTLLAKGKGVEADHIRFVAKGNQKTLIETPLAQVIFEDKELEPSDTNSDDDEEILLFKYESELYELEETYRLTIDIKEFEYNRRYEISQLIHPELSQFWDYKFYKIMEGNPLPESGNTYVNKKNIIDYFSEQLKLISVEKNMFFSFTNDAENNRYIFYLNYPYLGNDDFSFRTRLGVEVSEDKILIKVEPNITKKGLKFNLCNYKEAVETVKALCNEDLTPLNQMVNKIINRVFINYRNKENAFSAIKLMLKNKKIKCELFPENISVVISFYVPILKKSISERIYYREFNDNPGVLHEIEKYAKK